MVLNFNNMKKSAKIRRNDFSELFPGKTAHQTMITTNPVSVEQIFIQYNIWYDTTLLFTINKYLLIVWLSLLIEEGNLIVAEV